MQELHENLLTQEMKVKKYEYENKRNEERLASVNQEKDRLLNELNSLKETNEELQIMNEISNETKVSCEHKTTHDLSNNNFSDIELLSLPIELKFVLRFIFSLPYFIFVL